MSWAALRIEPSGPAPIFSQIARHVKESVTSGRLAAAERLPSVRDLARELRVNPNTVVRAYDELERDGWIVRRQGMGCFVSESRPRLPQGERRRQLAELARTFASEARHLEFSPEQIESALAAELHKLSAPNKR